MRIDTWRAVHIEDADLITRARTGDVAAYEEIVRRYQDVAIRTAHLVCPETDADDAVQDAFLKAYDALPRFRDGAPLRPWLLRIVTNEARNRRRSAGRRQGLALRARRRGEPRDAAVPGPEATVIAAESERRALGRPERPCAMTIERCWALASCWTFPKPRQPRRSGSRAGP